MTVGTIRTMWQRLFKTWRPVAPPPAVQATDRDAVAATLVYLIYFTMVAFTGFCLYVVLRFFTSHAPVEQMGGCDPNRANQCHEGEICERGRCVTEESPYCAEGASCDGCVCGYPLTCQSGACTKPSRQAPSCDAKTVELVTNLLDFEKACIQQAGGARFSNCEAKDLNKFLLNSENFESLLKGLPHGVTVLFPDRKPDLTENGELDTSTAAPWPADGPGGPTMKRYVDGMKGEGEPLRAARYIFLIGRAGIIVSNANSSYAKARVNFTKERILDAIAKDNVERAELAKKFVEFAIGGEKPMGLEFFATYNYPLITWNDESRRDISKTLQKAQNNSKLSPALRREVETMINRSVIAFAVPAECVQGK